ncbi:hypothetical protein Cfor_02909 [Coptotermes formosanus]|jgi:hypothetical protein|uniref:Uncharacterized protein n=1 Tax=Coptotermes formosanus TaxID=36987 RepID=A0A6L2PZD5_COPFO|nr:hypothetical protein Cfor_02909 [Coptotermes formosanus]
MKILLGAIQYNVRQWNICGYLKVTGMLMGMQGGFAKFCCFLCLWNSRSTAEHYIKNDWEPRKNYGPGKDNGQHILLVNPMKTFLPPLHIKLGLIRCLVKAMSKATSKGFQYSSKKISSISTAQLKEGIFVGPQI